MDSSKPLAASGTPAGAARSRQLRDARGRLYQPAIGPRLRVLLVFIFVGVAILGATALYLSVVRFLNWFYAPKEFTNPFTLGMFMAHVLVGVLLIGPFLVFGFIHLVSSRHRKNRPAVRLGMVLFATCIAVGISGLALIQLAGLPQLPTGTVRNVILILHGVAPLAAVGLYVLHRRAGPKIQWRWGICWGLAVGVFVVIMGYMHTQDPRRWYAKGSPEGEKYFEPSKS